MIKVLLFSNDVSKQVFELKEIADRIVEEYIRSLNQYVRRLIEREECWWEISEIYYVEKDPEAGEEPNIRAIIYSEDGRCRYLLYRRGFGRHADHWSMYQEKQAYRVE